MKRLFKVNKYYYIKLDNYEILERTSNNLEKNNKIKYKKDHLAKHIGAMNKTFENEDANIEEITYGQFNKKDIMAHELAHCIHKNHGHQFYALAKKYNCQVDEQYEKNYEYLTLPYDSEEYNIFTLMKQEEKDKLVNYIEKIGKQYIKCPDDRQYLCQNTLDEISIIE
jgi:hypothetical protein